MNLISHTSQTISLMNVLIIDDDAEDTELFCHALKDVAPHVNCSIMNDPIKELPDLERKNTDAPDYIFLDGHMHLINGKECLKRLKQMEAISSAKVIIYSGHMAESQLKEFRELGMEQYIPKPTSYEQLRILLLNMFHSQNRE
jgi:CheY-like chemotaxis protein